MKNLFQDLFDKQKRHFASGVTRSHKWRIEQLDRMAQLVQENEAALQRAVGADFKTASQEQVFETLACIREVEFQKSQLKDWMTPVEAPVPTCTCGYRASRNHLSRSLWSGLNYRSIQWSAFIVASSCDRSSRSRQLLRPQAEHGAQRHIRIAG